MCGRFTLTRVDYDDLARALEVEPVEAHRALYRPRFNLPPTDPHWILMHGEDGKRILEPARWGLVNFWAKDGSRAAMQINARVEGVRTSRAYREAFRQRRCAVPADGYFEWTGPAKAKQPIWYHRPDDGLILFAGLWEDWKRPDGNKVRTFTVLTTEARGRIANVHDRMPVLLDVSQADHWIDADEAGAVEELERSKTIDMDQFVIGTEVSRRVNSVKNDDPACLAPPEKTTLF